MTDQPAGGHLDDTDLYGPAPVTTADQGTEEAEGDWGGGGEEEYYEADGAAEAYNEEQTEEYSGAAYEAEAEEGAYTADADTTAAAEVSADAAEGVEEEDVDHTISVVDNTEETATYSKAMDGQEPEVVVSPDGEIVEAPTAAAAAGGHANAAPPETSVSAEIILVMTSLGSVRRMHFASKRLQHFLNCKGVVYYVVDVNRDASSGADLCDEELLEKWKAEDILLKDEDTADATEGLNIKIPQMLIDGVVVGDETAVQNLEEDGDLDWLLSRAACPSCLNEKNSSALVCPSCSTNFQTLIPEERLYEGAIQQVYRGQACNRGEAFEHQTLTPPPAQP